MISQLRKQLSIEVLKSIAISLLLALALSHLFAINFFFMLLVCIFLISTIISVLAIRNRRKLIKKIVKSASLLPDESRNSVSLSLVRGFTEEYFQKIELGSTPEGLIIRFLFAANKKPYFMPWDVFSDCQIQSNSYLVFKMKDSGLKLIVPADELLIKNINSGV